MCKYVGLGCIHLALHMGQRQAPLMARTFKSLRNLENITRAFLVSMQCIQGQRVHAVTKLISAIILNPYFFTLYQQRRFGVLNT